MAESVTELRRRLDIYLAAEAKGESGLQSWTVGNQNFTKYDLPNIKSVIDSLRREIHIVEHGGGFGCSQVVIGGRR